VHQRDALAKRRIEHGLTLLDIHLDADRLETHLMKHSFRHDFSTSHRETRTVVVALSGEPAAGKGGRVSGPNRPGLAG
jgi:pantothenate kinase